MHNWNAIFPVNTNKLDEAIMALDALIGKDSFPILEYLREVEMASLLDLSLFSGADADLLEGQAELLCQAGFLDREEDFSGVFFSLNFQRLRQASRLAGALAGSGCG